MGKLALFAVAVLGASVVLLSQAHQHSHDTEPAHYKYTKEANEEAVREVHSHSHEHHGHSHDHHGHSHDDDHHGHVHDHHGHTHDHGHSHDEHHGHSHGEGGCPYAHGNMEYDEDAYYYGSDDDEHYAGDHYNEHEHEHVVKATPATKSAKNIWPKTPYDPNGPLAFLNNIRTRLWVYSIGSTLLISIAPFLILSVIPIQANTAESAPLLKVLLAFGSGGLLGDAFLHLIPHAQPAGDGHSHSHSHAHSHGEGHAHAPHDMLVGGCVLAGIIAFLTVEKIVRIFRGEEGHSHTHSHAHSHDAPKPKDEAAKKDNEEKKKKQKKDKDSDRSSAEESSSEHHEEHDDEEENEEHSERAQLIPDRQTGFKVAAYLNLAADFAHNVTDGLAIGASFLAGTTVGVVTMITVLVHEVPHEIGDFAILVQSGFSKKRAMFVQLVTALGAITGCVVSLWAAEAYGDLSESTSTAPVLSFTAGGFIYIALVSVIPELLENTSAWQSVKESFAMMFGIYLMYLIGLYE